MHAVAPAAFWYVPSPHAEQSWLLALAANVPALHSVAEVAPAKQKPPAGQGWQPSCEVSPLSLPNEPAPHGLVTDAPSSQMPPSSHATQSVAPSPSWYVPAAQALHDAAPAAALMVPTEQSCGVVAPGAH